MRDNGNTKIGTYYVRDCSLLIAFINLPWIEEAQKIEDVLRDKMNTSIEEIMVKKNIKTLAPDDKFESIIKINI